MTKPKITLEEMQQSAMNGGDFNVDDLDFDEQMKLLNLLEQNQKEDLIPTPPPATVKAPVKLDDKADDTEMLLSPMGAVALSARLSGTMAGNSKGIQNYLSKEALKIQQGDTAHLTEMLLSQHIELRQYSLNIDKMLPNAKTAKELSELISMKTKIQKEQRAIISSLQKRTQPQYINSQTNIQNNLSLSPEQDPFELINSKLIKEGKL